MSKKILFVVNDLGFFISHRLNLALAARKNGFCVSIAYGVSSKLSLEKIQMLEIKSYKFSIRRGGLNPFFELITLLSIFKIFWKINPDIVHLITIKAYIYGGIAARLLKIPGVVSAITGLGSLFLKDNMKARALLKILQPVFKYVFRHKNQVIIVQNPDDRQFVSKLVGPYQEKIIIIKGTGIDLSDFTDLKDTSGKIFISFIGRLLKDKGVVEFVDAAYLLKQKGCSVVFQLVGDIDTENPSSINKRTLEKWKNEGVVKPMGYCNNLPGLLSKTHIVCLPSYREGLPRALIEASASACAIVTTDVPGCREAVIPHKTGLLVPAKNTKLLADAMQFLIENPNLTKQMGIEGRKYVESTFINEKITSQHLNVYNFLAVTGAD